MSQITYRGNLSAKGFPFLAENQGRSVIVSQYDNAFNRQVVSSEDTDKDIGIPQVYYCHNVMPHPQGFQSIAYQNLLKGGLANFYLVFPLRDNNNNRGYLGIDLSGNFYIFQGTGTWILKQNFPVASGNSTITTAFVSGITYIYVEGYGCFYYDFGLGTFTAVTLGGLNITGTNAIVGICPSAGYLIAWSATTVYWSSTVDPTDFVPSLITGAGAGAVEGAKGAINFCLPHLLGFIVYTLANAVAALFSGNSRFPFNFREIVASGGVSGFNLIASGADSGNHYTYTTSGFQLVSTSSSTTIYPELTDFIGGKLFEDFNDATKTFSTVALTSTMQKALNVIADRYLVISYGISSLTHALVYDLVQKRYGKLKINHVASFEYQLPNVIITEQPRQSIAFLQIDGSIQLVDFSVSNPASNGTILLGKYQFVRPRLLTLDEINLENIRVGATFALTDMYTLDGKNYLYATPTLTQNVGLFRKYNCRITGLNHSLLFQGAWEICSNVLVFHISGKR